MVPLRLHLYNFLSYGDHCEPIELGGIHVACLCGPNGHGKSALLDAMTWALWGQGRAASADEMIRLGQSSMFVELEFLLEGQRYRVVRKRTRGKSGQSDLQFQVRREASGEWSALSGQGVRGTQERICGVLRMDYETFINSAFILQGRADEFARKTPGDRKRILGEILSLGVYDQLCDRARTCRREAEQRADSIAADLARLEAEYADLPQRRSAEERLEKAHLEARLAAEQARNALQAVLLEEAALAARRRERDDLARRLAGAEAELETLRRQHAQAARQVEAHASLASRAGEVRGRAQRYYAVAQERDEMTARVGEVRALEAEAARHRRREDAARAVLETQLQLARQRVRELADRAEQLPKLEADARDLDLQVNALDALRTDRDAVQARLEELAGSRAAAQGEQRRCADELERADERFQLLKAARAQCPLCEGELTEDKRKELGWRLREEREGLRAAQGRAIQAEADARKADTEARRSLKELEAKLKSGQLMRDRLAQARQKRLELEQSAAELPAERERAEALGARLEASAVDPEAAAGLAACELRLKSLAFDEKRLGELARLAGELAGAERDLHALEQAEADLPGERARAEELAASLRAREEALAADRVTRAEADRELARAPEVEAEVGRRKAHLAERERAEAALAQQLGAAREGRQRCEGLAAVLEERRAERAAAQKEQGLYEELARAFGRNGIQALIIENAVPEIEQEANALLARMSEGQLLVRLKTQRELRGGGQSETLEIEISDGMGARKYEMYSGGEAFRVNFALRIALSKLLARRAGARLETLVIDEGFGTQDLEGRQRLVEAIHAVQDEFARILVITHLDDLKDAFPTRLEVTKGPSGSQVAVY